MTGLFSTPTTERVLLYLQAYGQGHARAVAGTLEAPLRSVQLQLARLETEGVLVSQFSGRTKLYLWNPRYPLLPELSALLDKALRLMPKDERQRYFSERRRPRRSGKPL